MLPKELVLLAALMLLLGFAGQNSANFEELAARATAAREQNDTTRAIDLYKQALARNSKWEEGWWFLGSMYYDGDRYAEGREALAHVVELDQNAAPAWALLGLCEFETGDYAQALAAIEKSLAGRRLDPKLEGVVRFHEALLLTREGKFEAALRAYAWFAQRGVRNPQVIEGAGLATLRAAKLPKEIPSAEEALYDAAGQAAIASLSGDFASAREAFAKLVEQHPQAHYVHYASGTFLLAMDPRAAEHEFELELQQTPDSGATNAMLAWMHLQQNDAEGAYPFAQRAIEQDAGLPLAQYVYGRVLNERGELSGAIEHLERAVREEPKNLEAHVWLANAYARAARPLEARQEREAAMRLSREEQPVANP